ncbi:MAG: hypothetical protein EA353_05470 [Puniceicoccaceae bacterium]|nr:MAG: hypothetical protein EA353_05470 [Puniceicoccaceae bacterium]
MAKLHLIAAGVSVSACLLTPALSHGQIVQWNGLNVFTNEHVEINVSFDPATQTLSTALVEDENQDNNIPSDESLFWIRQNHLAVLPNLSSDYSALGEQGDPVYLLPSSNPGDRIYHGFSAYGVDFGDVETPFELKLTAFAGPGNMLVWLNPNNPPLIDSTRQAGNYGGISMGINAHLHRIWGFSEPGIYRLTFAAAGDLFGTTTPAASVSSDYIYLIDPRPYQWWQVRHFGKEAVEPEAALDAPTGAPGISNLLAYALDLNPAQPASADLPRMVFMQDAGQRYPALQFRFPGGEPERDDRSDLIYQVEATHDLTGTWSTLVADEDFTWEPAGLDHDDTPLVRAVLNDSIESAPARFLRLRVILLED